MTFKERIELLARDLLESRDEAAATLRSADAWLRSRGKEPIKIFNLMKDQVIALCYAKGEEKCGTCQLAGLTTDNIPVIETVNLMFINGDNNLCTVEPTSSFICLLCMHQIANEHIGIITGELSATLLNFEHSEISSKILTSFIDRRLAISTFRLAFAYDELVKLGIEDLDDMIMTHAKKMCHI